VGGPSRRCARARPHASSPAPYCTMLLATTAPTWSSSKRPKAAKSGRPGYARATRTSSCPRTAASARPRLDCAGSEARALLLRILPHSTCWWRNYRPDVMERFGLPAQELTERFPRLVYCADLGVRRRRARTATGRLRPDRAGHDGFMSLTGTEETGPDARRDRDRRRARGHLRRATASSLRCSSARARAAARSCTRRCSSR